MNYAEFINLLNEIVWSDYLIYMALIAGIGFTLLTRFVQVRYIKEMIKLLTRSKSSESGVSSFQAFALAISGRVGTGNIAGVAAAIYFGGPGSIFWMWVIAFLGSASAFIESTLGQIYKVKKDGEYRGGPSYYIQKGLGIKWFAVLFAIVTLVSNSIFLPGVQAKSIASGMETAFNWDPLVTGFVVVLFLGLIIVGGVKRIGKTAQIIVPIMALAYMLVATLIIVINIGEIPDIIELIVSSAFGQNAVFGGMLGTAIAWGVKRGVYSNEAGQGSTPHAAAAAEVSHPVKQGLVQAFSVYIDTLLVCSATAFMILFTGQYNVLDPSSTAENAVMVVENLPGIEFGTAFTQYAVDNALNGFGKPFVAISLLFFAFTTLMAYYYYAETNIAYIFTHKWRKMAIWGLRIVMLTMVVIGATHEAGLAWAMGDIGVGIMAWLNFIAIFLLAKPALMALKDYEKQKKEGKDPHFLPSKLGIKNAELWEEINGESVDNGKG